MARSLRGLRSRKLRANPATAVSSHEDKTATQFAADTSIENALISGSLAQTNEREEKNMSETPVVPEPRSFSGLFLALLAVAVLAAIAGLAWSYHLSGRVTNAEAKLSQAQQRNEKLAAALDETNARLKVTTDSLGRSLGLTQQQIETRAQDILRRQAADTKRLETAQAQTDQH